MRFKSRSRALAASALAASVGLAGLTTVATPAGATEDTEIIRIEGANRFETAAEAAATAFPSGATNAILASGTAFADALGGAGLAGALDAPILLTLAGSLPAATADALEDLGVDNVTILGGTSAVSEAVADALEADGYTVDRVAGANRFATAAAIADELPAGDTVVLANGLGFADALAMSPGANALELPVLLTEAATLRPESAAVLADDAIDTVIIPGGTAVVSQAIEDALEDDGKTVVRLAGANRFETAVEVAEFHLTVGFDAENLVLASGQNFPDALAGGPLAAAVNGPMVLTNPEALSAPTAAFMGDVAQDFDTLYVLGGTAAVSNAAANAAAAAGQAPAPTTNATFQVRALAGSGTQVIQHPGTPGTNTSGAAVSSYEVTGLAPGATYDIALFPCGGDDGGDWGIRNDGAYFPDENGMAGPDGMYTFSREQALDLNYAANAGSTWNGDAEIGFISGAGNGVLDSSQGEFVADAGGRNTFEVRLDTNSDSDCAVPVVWREVAGDTDANNLNLAARSDGVTDEFSAPSEAFGVGEPTVFHFGEAPNGYDHDQTILFLNKAENYYVGDDGYMLKYGRGNDTYFNNFPPSQLTLAQFEQLISVGDYIENDEECNNFFGFDVNYSRTGPNCFDLYDDTIQAVPTNVAVSLSDLDNNGVANDATITWENPAVFDGVLDDICIDQWRLNPDGTRTNLGNLDCFGAFQVLNGPAKTSYTSNNVPQARTFYVVYYETDYGNDSPYSQSSNLAVHPNVADTTRPTVLDARLTTDALLQGQVDDGDVYKLVFSKTMDATTASAGIFVLTSANGDVVTVTCSADCVLNAAAETVGGVSYPANRVLTITVDTAGDTAITDNAPADGVHLYPLTITTVNAQVRDTLGLIADIPNSADKVIDVEA